MANLTLCRLVRGVSGFSRFVPKNDRFLSTYNCRAIGKINAASLSSASFQFATSVHTRPIHQQLSEVLTQLPAASAMQCRSMSSGDHVRLWQVERIVSAAFIALLPAVVILQNPIVDGLFATLVVVHAHWGLEAVIVDYARPSVVGNILPKVAFLALYLFSAFTFVGLLALIYSGPGIGKTVKNFWAIGSNPPAHSA